MKNKETPIKTNPILEIGDLVRVLWKIHEPFYGYVIRIDYEYEEHSYLVQPFKPLPNSYSFIDVWLFDRHMGEAWEKI